MLIIVVSMRYLHDYYSHSCQGCVHCMCEMMINYSYSTLEQSKLHIKITTRQEQNKRIVLSLKEGLRLLRNVLAGSEQYAIVKAGK